MNHFTNLETPSLILNKKILTENCKNMRKKCSDLKTKLRPHIKTPKSIEIARIALNNKIGPITVSTLKEAEYFASAGFKDILYAVGIVPNKLIRIKKIQHNYNCSVKLILDSVQMANAVAKFSSINNIKFDILIEIDSGEGRGGLKGNDKSLKEISYIFKNQKISKLIGIMTHAGHSYSSNNKINLISIANQEREELLKAKKFLKNVGQFCSIVSLGSTPTILNATNLSNITEARCGVYMLWDLAQASKNICKIENIAISVLASVIHHNVQEQRIIIDAGALALSKDFSANKFMPTAKYGLVCNVNTGEPIPRMCVNELHQEHGTINVTDKRWFELLPIGSLVRVLPNHACLTCAAHEQYHVLDKNLITETWKRTNGW